MGGLLENQHVVWCGGAHVSWDKWDGYEPGCYKMYETQPFQVRNMQGQILNICNHIIRHVDHRLIKIICYLISYRISATNGKKI